LPSRAIKSSCLIKRNGNARLRIYHLSEIQDGSHIKMSENLTTLGINKFSL